MTIKYTGELEIDKERGVIYFHSDLGITILRICCLPTPIPLSSEGLDITHGYGVSWKGNDTKFKANVSLIAQNLFGDTKSTNTKL